MELAGWNIGINLGVELTEELVDVLDIFSRVDINHVPTLERVPGAFITNWNQTLRAIAVS